MKIEAFEFVLCLFGTRNCPSIFVFILACYYTFSEKIEEIRELFSVGIRIIIEL